METGLVGISLEEIDLEVGIALRDTEVVASGILAPKDVPFVVKELRKTLPSFE